MYLVHPESCGGCRWDQPPIPGDGPQPAKLFFLGEGPAKEEVRRRMNFMGSAGKEYNYHYLPLAGLSRLDVYTSNATHCPMEDYRNPTHEEARICASHWLPRELRYVQPEVLIPMGAVACSLWPDIDLELDHGIPQWGQYGDWEGVIFPVFHPAAGIHTEYYMPLLRADFEALGLFLKGELDAAEDQFPSPLYLEADSGMVMETAGTESEWIAMDTERDMETGDPFCTSYSVAPGTGFMVPARSQALQTLAECLGDLRPRVLLHNAPHDLPELLKMGVRVSRFTDTMQMAYHLGLQQSLKTLAYRLCGMRMREYEEVVHPPCRVLAMDYLSQVSRTMESALLEPIKRGKNAGKLRRQEGADPAHVHVLRKIQKALNDPQADPWKRWDGWGPADHEIILQYVVPSTNDIDWLLGAPGKNQMPRPSLSHVPYLEMVYYSCRDPDATLRIYPKLVELSRKFRARV